MGVKELWTVLSPVCEKKPLWELQDKSIAIDLSAWIVDSQNVADNSQRNVYLRNLFFRTSYLLLLGAKPIFVLGGAAPKLKYDTIARRQNSQSSIPQKNGNRSRLTMLQKQCQKLLESIGLTCVKGKGEAEAYCARLNQDKVVDGVISQDSDCFLYGAQVVLRNFTMSPTFTCDLYQMPVIQKRLGLGRQKLLAISLLCGCDYENGVQGVGKESALKFLATVSEHEVLNRLKDWRNNSAFYDDLEKKTKRAMLTTEQKLELSIRKKALQDHNFPSEEVIAEFLNHQEENPPVFVWNCPNLHKFLQFADKYLGWENSYANEKITPLLTRWHLLNNGADCGLKVISILKKRVVRGVASYEMKWEGEETGEISTVEPQDLVSSVYSDLHEAYILSKQKPKKDPKRKKNKPLSDVTNMNAMLQRLSIDGKKQPNKKRIVNKNDTGLQTLDKFLLKGCHKTDNLTCSVPLSQSTPNKHPQNYELKTSFHYCESDEENKQSPLRKNKLKIDSFESSSVSAYNCDETDLDLSDIVNSIISKPSVLPLKKVISSQ